jgi:hypothetical protein
MDEDELKKRTKRFELRIIKLVNALPRTIAGRAIGGQLVWGGHFSWRQLQGSVPLAL